MNITPETYLFSETFKKFSLNYFRNETKSLIWVKIIMEDAHTFGLSKLYLFLLAK